MTSNKGTHGEEQHMGNDGGLWEHLGRFLNKKITSSDLEARRETTDDFSGFMMNYSHVLTEKIFFEIFFSNSIYIMDLMCDKLLQ